ncbi:Importin-beta N-terminal domain [Carpediemonas membranifera]|uniref:Importin-beta N-terminal domain n=1 Tax=Carpediemonas membranifera TaxID=201153 RepID=A0A8J6E4L3_9EUKA|nr:Importin-beta N-terminal domain [Carpediemonas membranifera]|eukprot:KAG9394627.1 Importin-beta N-terminal domain [Carpediemonas membranifera]
MEAPRFDAQLLYRSIDAALHSMNNEERENATNYIQHESIIFSPEYLPQLIRFIMDDSTNDNIRKFSAVVFKNAIKRHWAPYHTSAPTFANSVKQEVRNQIVGLVLASSQMGGPVRDLLVVALDFIILADYEQIWKEIVERVTEVYASFNSSVASGHVSHEQLVTVHTAIKMSLVAFRTFRFRQNKVREATTAIFSPLLAPMCAIGRHLMGHDPNPLVGAMLLDIIKTLRWSIEPYVPPVMLQENGKLFMILMESVLAMSRITVPPLPADIPATDVQNELIQSPYWKIRKHAFKCANRFFQRKLAESETDADSVVASMVPQLIPFVYESVAGILQSVIEHGMTSPNSPAARTMYIALALCQTLVVHTEASRNVVGKPEEIHRMMWACIHVVDYTAEDDFLWESDPEEYVRQQYSIMTELTSPKYAARGLLAECAKAYNLSSELITQSQNIVGGQVPGVSPYAGIEVIMTLSSCMTRGGPLLPTEFIPSLLSDVVIPMMGCDQRQLRAQACNLLTSLLLNASEDGAADIPIEVIGPIAEKILGLLVHDPESPVRVNAANCIKYLIHRDDVVSLLSDRTLQLIQALLKITCEMSNEEIALSLVACCDAFASHLTPQILDLSRELANIFFSLMQKVKVDESFETNILSDDRGFDPDESEDNIIQAATQILNALTTLAEHVADQDPQQYNQVEEILLTCIRNPLERGQIDCFEEVGESLAVVSHRTPTIKGTHWEMFAVILTTADQFHEFVLEFIPFLSNMIVRDPASFLSHTGFHEAISKLVEELLSETIDDDTRYGAYLALAITQGLKAYMVPPSQSGIEPKDQQMLQALMMRWHNAVAECITRLSNDPESSMTMEQLVLFMDAFASLCFIHPALAMHVYGRHLDAMLTRIANSLLEKKNPAFNPTRPVDKWLQAAGLATLLTVPPDALSVQLTNQYPALLNLIVSLLEARATQEQDEMNTGADWSDTDFDFDALMLETDNDSLINPLRSLNVVEMASGLLQNPPPHLAQAVNPELTQRIAALVVWTTGFSGR